MFYSVNPKETANLTMNMKMFYSTDMKKSLLHAAVGYYWRFSQFRVQLIGKVVDFCEDNLISVRMQAAFVFRKLSNQCAFIAQKLIDMIRENH
jgi:hypothetical protein